MKQTTLLLFVLVVGSLALGQVANATFPQSANPALINGERYLPLVVEPTIVPPAMASNEAGSAKAPLAWHHNVKLGPANEPSLDLTENTMPSGKLELGSPFPQAANPSRK